MKSILLSIRPEQVANILNGKQTIIVRKNFPKDYVGWVYIYCTKGNGDLVKIFVDGKPELWCAVDFKVKDSFNGLVLARFWCDKVEDITFNGYFHPNDDEYTTNTMNGKELMKSSCLDLNHLVNYLEGTLKKRNVGFAIHISKIEVFDKPRELRTFCRYQEPSEHSPCWHCKRFGTGCYSCNLTKAPQNYQFIESEE